MPTTLNREAFEKLIDEDIEWLKQQTRTLERDHIETCLEWVKEVRRVCFDTQRELIDASNQLHGIKHAGMAKSTLRGAEAAIAKLFGEPSVLQPRSP